MPASMTRASISCDEEEGPMVATIFVRRGEAAIDVRLSRAWKRIPPRIHRGVAELLLDPQERSAWGKPCFPTNPLLLAPAKTDCGEAPGQINVLPALVSDKKSEV